MTSFMTSFLFLLLFLCNQLNNSLAQGIWEELPRTFGKPLDDGEFCDLYLSQSTIPNAGRGVFAGRDFQMNDTVDISPTIYIQYEQIYKSILQDYIFASDHNDFGLLMIGMGSLFNHADNNSLEHFSMGEELSKPTLQVTSLTAQTGCSLDGTRNLRKGEELYLNYGPDWFANRNISISSDNNIQSGNTDSSRRVCLTNVEIRDTTRYAANHGLFAKKHFQKGELITVSPALILPAFLLNESANSSLLMNYCYYKAGSKFAVVPISSPAMMNHYKSIYFTPLFELEGEEKDLLSLEESQKKANVQMHWFNWNFFQTCQSTDEESSCESDPRLLFPETHILRKGSEWDGYASATLGYYAVDDIEEGEELLLDYGNQWETAYRKYLDDIDEYDDSDNTGADEGMIFRQWIEARNGLFPGEWFE
jgi:hypothetical protein